MTTEATSVEHYFEQLPEDRVVPMRQLRQVILDNLPADFTETLTYGMVGYVVPHSVYPAGYHCDPKQPLPFISIASQKNFIAVYHMGIYALPSLMDWWLSEFPKHSSKKLDIGKSCIRFKKPADIPFALIGELAQKISAAEWIEIYEANYKR